MNSNSWQPIAAHVGSQDLPSRRIIQMLAEEIRSLWSSNGRQREGAGWTRLDSAQVAELLAPERAGQPRVESAPAVAAAVSPRRRRSARRYRRQLTQPLGRPGRGVITSARPGPQVPASGPHSPASRSARS